jgi:predicted  nucleic acid-binding Zn-ribbon protein
MIATVDRLMGRTLRSDRHRVQALSKRKVKTQNEIEELREENRRLRELVAHLSKLVVERIAETAARGESSASDPHVRR